MVEAYNTNGVLERWSVCYVATHRDGSTLVKILMLWRALAHFLWLVMTSDIRLVHAHTASRSSFVRKSIFFRLCKAFGLPYIIHLHGAEFLKFYRDECSVAAQGRVASVFNNSQAVIALSPRWAEALHELFPKTECHVAPNPVRFAQVEPQERTGTNILFSGRLNSRKGIFDLLNAFALVSKRFPGARLECCGDGDLAAVRTRVRELGLEATIGIRGWVGREEIRRRLAQSDIFVLPSHDEGLPMSLLEAMSASLAVVTTPVGGIPDLVIDGDNGLLVPPGDSESLAKGLLRLLESGEERARLGAAASRTVTQRYSTANALRMLDECYRQLGLTPRTPSPSRAPEGDTQ